MIRKLTGRLIAFILFGVVFICMAGAVLAISTGLIDVRRVFPNLPDTPTVDFGDFSRPDVTCRCRISRCRMCRTLRRLT